MRAKLPFNSRSRSFRRHMSADILPKERAIRTPKMTVRRCAFVAARRVCYS